MRIARGAMDYDKLWERFYRDGFDMRQSRWNRSHSAAR